MWIFLHDSFLSIVHKDGDADTLLVRARRRGDLERVFPEATVTATPEHDYPFRALLGRERVAERLAESARTIGYPNFKAAVREVARHDAYLNVWHVMNRFQRAD